IFLLGVMTIAQFSFWGNYLPRVYPTYLRGTGESFAANVGGRMFGTTAALVTTQLVNFMPGSSAPTRLAFAAAFVGTTVYLIGFFATRAVRTSDDLNAAAHFVDRNVDEGRGAKVAIECGPETVTYAQLLERVNRVGTALRRELKVRPEERIALLLLDTPAFA